MWAVVFTPRTGTLIVIVSETEERANQAALRLMMCHLIDYCGGKRDQEKVYIDYLLEHGPKGFVHYYGNLFGTVTIVSATEDTGGFRGIFDESGVCVTEEVGGILMPIPLGKLYYGSKEYPNKEASHQATQTDWYTLGDDAETIYVRCKCVPGTILLKQEDALGEVLRKVPPYFKEIVKGEYVCIKDGLKEVWKHADES